MLIDNLSQRQSSKTGIIMHTLSLIQPDDWHVHFRDADVLQHTVSGTATHFARALVMPNLKPALTDLTALLAYRERIIAALPHHASFTPYMTFYINEGVKPDDLIAAKKYPFILGAKLYPAGATTNSSQGVTSIRSLYPLLEILQANDLVLQIHGEITFGDIFDREALFIRDYLEPILQNFPKLRIVLEHISTQTAVDWVSGGPDTLAATITPHHLLYNRNHLLEGGIKPHFYCLPVLKRESDQYAIQRAAVSGNPRFFAGTDSAPHAQTAKESACGCAGIYSAPYAVALYTEMFDQLGKLPMLNAFLSQFGAHFYHLPMNTGHLMLQKKPQQIPDTLPLGANQVIPIAAGSTLRWSVHETH